MNPQDIKVVPVCCCGLVCFWAIFGIIALPLSFKSLEQGKYGLGLSWHTQKVDDEPVIEPGMYFVGLGNMLIEYPSTFQTMYFVADTRGITKDEDGEEDQTTPIKRGPLRARSADGLEMIVSVSFQWQLEAKYLKPLYDILGGTTVGDVTECLYRDEFVRFARAAIVESCAKFAADSFFTNRTLITSDMLQMVRENFHKADKGMHLTIKGLQLREVDLPNAFDEEIVKTQEQMQEVEVALAEREEQEISMQRDLAVMKQTVLKMVEESRGTAGDTIRVNAATVEQVLVLEEKNAIANAKILEQLDNSTGSDPYGKLMEIMQVGAIQNHNYNNLVMSM